MIVRTLLNCVKGTHWISSLSARLFVGIVLEAQVNGILRCRARPVHEREGKCPNSFQRALLQNRYLLLIRFPAAINIRPAVECQRARVRDLCFWLKDETKAPFFVAIYIGDHGRIVGFGSVQDECGYVSSWRCCCSCCRHCCRYWTLPVGTGTSIWTELVAWTVAQFFIILTSAHANAFSITTTADDTVEVVLVGFVFTVFFVH